MSSNYYIYYRIAPQHSGSIADRVREMQIELAQKCGVRGRLLTKRDEPMMRMEIYESVANASVFESTLDALVDKHALATLVEPGAHRHTECFVD